MSELTKNITFEVSALKESSNALVDHFEVKFSKPVNGQWLYEAIERALKKSIQSHEPDVVFNKRRRRLILDWAERWKQNLPFKAYETLLSILKASPEEQKPIGEARLLKFIEKEADWLIQRFENECGKLENLQRIGILHTLTEKGDLWDILRRYEAMKGGGDGKKYSQGGGKHDE